MSLPSHSTLERVAFYGGTFDPVHLGHLAVARAALERFELDRIYFVPAFVQPLKVKQKVTHFYHRYAMLSLAVQGEPRFVPSLLEAPESIRATGAQASYTVDTLHRLRDLLPPTTRLFCILGMDAFQHIAKWRSPVELLRSAEFVVASRPGFPLSEVAQALPLELRPDETGARQLQETGSLETNGAHIHLLPDVNEEVSATEIREAARRGSGLERLVPRGVADYIVKLKIYEDEEEPGSPEPPRD
jgi:nicotinate-nucleotide adenylyltransferase